MPKSRPRTALTITALLLLAGCSSSSSNNASNAESSNSERNNASASGTASGNDSLSDGGLSEDGFSEAESPDREGQDGENPEGTATDQATEVIDLGGPELRDRTCEGKPSANATCYWISVPADWSNPDGTKIDLPIAVLAAQGGITLPDPIVAPAGGPGYSGSTHYWWSTYPQNQSRDMIIYDQRGTGSAIPSLACPELQPVEVLNFQRNEPFDIELASVVDAASACRSRLEAAGVDLNDYDSEANALDLDAIRRSLNYPEWNILGVSYGSRLALASMRSTPEGIRAVVLDSVMDVDFGGFAANAESGRRALDLLIEMCATDADCTESHGDLGLALEQIRETFNADPAEIQADIGDGNGSQTFVLTGDDIMGGLHLALYRADFIPLLPTLITGFNRGDLRTAPTMLQSALGSGAGLASAMEWSVDCADNAGVNQADIEFQVTAGHFSQLVLEPNCEYWPVDPTSSDFNEPVISDIPVLVLAGVLDPVTPSDRSEAVAERMTTANFALFPNRSHRVSGEPCADAIQIDFLDNPTEPLDMSCMDSLIPFEFS